MKALLRQGFFLSGCLLAINAFALQEDAQLKALADSPYWHRLLKDDSPDDGYYRSQQKSPTFFLSENGHTDAYGELLATLEGLTDQNTSSATACRFPARKAWLAEAMPELSRHWPQAICSDLDEWLRAIDAKQATLVFASDYLNNPSSMFGHTLLRIDAHKQADDTRLLAYAINYAAQTNTSNGLEFAIKGLTGGYQGQYSLLPYYEKVKEYNDWESRDLWEYELSLTREEVHRLLLAYWDWRGLGSPYYFFSRNCSYELLGLLEMARPGLQLQRHFPAHAIPADTLRVVLAEPNMLHRVTWRAASGTRRQAAMNRNRLAVNRAVIPLLDADKAVSAPTGLSATEQAQALETAYDEFYARYLGREVPKETAPAHLRALLTERSRLSVPDQRVTLQRPDTDPASGHGTSRWGIGLAADQEDRLLVSFRPAHHDWLDSPQGYREGARIDFLSGTFGTNPKGQVSIETMSLVAIDSLVPVDTLNQPLSWSIRVGADRALADDDRKQRHGMTVIEGGAGMAFRLDQSLCHLQAHNDVRGSRSLDRGWEIGVGARMGCIGQIAGRMQWMAETRPMYRLPSDRLTWQAIGGLQLSMNRDQAIRLELRQEWREVSLGSASVQWLRYF